MKKVIIWSVNNPKGNETKFDKLERIPEMLGNNYATFETRNGKIGLRKLELISKWDTQVVYTEEEN